MDRDDYSRLYVKQLRRIFGREHFDLLVFPGYETDPYSGVVKYGRSYSGMFNPLSPYVFITVSKVLRQLGICDAEYIPVSISYERIPEDVLFREFRAKTHRPAMAKYIYDHYYTFFKAPYSKELRQEKSRVCMKFGEGIPTDFSGRGRNFAETVRYEIAKMTRVYETTLIFHSLNNRFMLPKRDLKLKRLLKRLSKYDALIIDDIGYVQQDREEMEVLFVLLAERYERGSVMLTSNLPFSKWEKIFKDPMTTAAAIDRLVHHSVILELNLPSYRLVESNKGRSRKKESSPKEKTSVATGKNRE